MGAVDATALQSHRNHAIGALWLSAVCYIGPAWGRRRRSSDTLRGPGPVYDWRRDLVAMEIEIFFGRLITPGDRDAYILARSKRRMPTFTTSRATLARRKPSRCPLSISEAPSGFFILGAETAGNHRRLSSANPDAISARGLSQSPNMKSSITRMARPRREARFGGRSKRSAHCSGFRTRRALAWSNVFKVQLAEPTGSASILARENKVSKLDLDADVAWQSELSRMELEFIQPHAVLILSESAYLDFGKTHGVKWVDGDDTYRTGRIETLGVPVAQTYHPGAHIDPQKLKQGRERACEFLISQMRKKN